MTATNSAPRQFRKTRPLIQLGQCFSLVRVAVSIGLLLRRSDILGVVADQLGNILITGGSWVDTDRVADAVANGRRGVDVGEAELALDRNGSSVDGDLNRVGAIGSRVCKSYILDVLGSRSGEGEAGEEGSGGSDELHFDVEGEKGCRALFG